jgi:hypothetical protein
MHLIIYKNKYSFDIILDIHILFKMVTYADIARRSLHAKTKFETKTKAVKYCECSKCKTNVIANTCSFITYGSKINSMEAPMLIISIYPSIHASKIYGFPHGKHKREIFVQTEIDIFKRKTDSWMTFKEFHNTKRSQGLPWIKVDDKLNVIEPRVCGDCITDMVKRGTLKRYAKTA